jgi:hypothetical protein
MRVKRIGPGLVSIDGAVWRVRASRKVCRCGATRKLVLPGDLVYAPTKTKRSVRSLRIAAEVVEEAAEAGSCRRARGAIGTTPRPLWAFSSLGSGRSVRRAAPFFGAQRAASRTWA